LKVNNMLGLKRVKKVSKIMLLMSSFLFLVLILLMAIFKESLDYQDSITKIKKRSQDYLSNDQKIIWKYKVMPKVTDMVSLFSCRIGAPSKSAIISPEQLKIYLLKNLQDSLWCEQFAKMLWYDLGKIKSIKVRYLAIENDAGKHSFCELGFFSKNKTSWIALHPTSKIIAAVSNAELLDLGDISQLVDSKNKDSIFQENILALDCAPKSIFGDLIYFSNIKKIYIYKNYPKTNIWAKMLQKLSITPYRIYYNDEPNNVGFFIKNTIVIFFIFTLVFTSIIMLWNLFTKH